MIYDDVRAAWKRAPFTPFRVNLADGRQFDVPHPDFMWVDPVTRRRAIVVDPLGGWEALNLRMIVSLGFGQSPPETDPAAPGDL